MLIKGIIHERTEDAPFVGALIIANDCSRNCPNCFNQYLKEQEPINLSATQIIEEVLKNPFNTGIILAGLEWTLQPDDMISLIKCAFSNNLEIILYTGMSEKEFNRNFKKIKNVPNIYIKFGAYKEEEKCTKKEYGVILSSRNQYIYHNNLDFKL